MKYNLNGLLTIYNNLRTWKGSDVTRDYWARILAEYFPIVIRDKNGRPTVLEFLGRKFYSKGAKRETKFIDIEKLEEVKRLVNETRRLQSEDEWVEADEYYFQLLDKGLIDWMIQEIEEIHKS